MDNTHASSARITGIYRYPVKGLTPEPLPHAELKIGETLRSDRRYAIENGPSGFDPSAPKWLPKPHFLMLQRDEWLAPLRAHFDDDSHVHEAGAPQAGATGRIAAEIAARLGHDAGRAEAACRTDAAGVGHGVSAAGQRRCVGFDDPARPREGAALGARQPRCAPIMTMGIVARVMAGMGRMRVT